jgi:hypothetical protein
METAIANPPARGAALIQDISFVRGSVGTV